MHGRHLAIWITLCTLLLALGAAAPAQDAPKPRPKPPSKPSPEKLVIGDRTFTLDVAADPEAREKGLKGVSSIKPGGGMLFIYPKSDRRTFWMADCVVDMDIIFLDQRGKIVRTHEMKVEPPQRKYESRQAYERRLKRYRSTYRAQFAIELRAGTVKQLKLKRGHVIELDAARLKKIAT